MNDSFARILILIVFSALIVQSHAQVAGPVDVGPNEYAFRYTLDNDFGLFFNSTTGHYEFRDGTAAPVVRINAVNGDMDFGPTGDLLIGGNKYAFRYKTNPLHGLLFNETSVQYQFTNNVGSSVFSIGALSGQAILSGGLKIGNSTTSTGGSIRYFSGDFAGHNGAEWLSLTKTSSIFPLEGDGTTSDPVTLSTTAFGPKEMLLFGAGSWVPHPYGFFDEPSPFATDPPVIVLNGGMGPAMLVNQESPSSEAAIFEITDMTGMNPGPVITARTFTDGMVMELSSLDTMSSFDVLRVHQEGVAGGIAVTNESRAITPLLIIDNKGKSGGLSVKSKGEFGAAVFIENSDSSAATAALEINHSNPFDAVKITQFNSLSDEPIINAVSNHVGDGILISIDNPANDDNALFGSTNGVGTAVRAKNTNTSSGKALIATSAGKFDNTVFIENLDPAAEEDVVHVRGSIVDTGYYVLAVTNITTPVNNAAFFGGGVKVAGKMKVQREFEAFFDSKFRAGLQVNEELTVLQGGFIGNDLIVGDDIYADTIFANTATYGKIAADTVIAESIIGDTVCAKQIKVDTLCAELVKTTELQVGTESIPTGIDAYIDGTAAIDILYLDDGPILGYAPIGFLLDVNGASRMNELMVGSSSPVPTGYKAAVDGKFIAEEVMVQLSGDWPDYVFAENYNLPKLSHIKKHIDKHKRLPGIPSAEEVKEEGIPLGEMNAKLLKKIEELTLYLIQQQEDLDKLKADNERLSKAVFGK